MKDVILPTKTNKTVQKHKEKKHKIKHCKYKTIQRWRGPVEPPTASTTRRAQTYIRKFQTSNANSNSMLMTSQETTNDSPSLALNTMSRADTELTDLEDKLPRRATTA